MATLFQRIVSYSSGIRFRLSLVYSGIFGAGLICVAVFMTYEYLGSTREENDQALRSFAIDISHFVTPKTDKIRLDSVIQSEIGYFPFLIQNTMVSVRTLEGKLLYSNRPDYAPPHRPNFIALQLPHEFSSFVLPTGQRMRAVNIRTTHLDRPLVIQVASAISELEAQQDRHIYFLIGIISISIILTAVTSNIVAGKALKPLRETIKQVEELMTNETYRPLPVPPTQDELAQLTRSYNLFLEQINRTLTAQDQFVSHASHQLNTPLAIMRGELELLLSKPRSSEEVANFHRSLAQELERLGQLVRDMLLVSRVEAGRASFRFSPLRLDEIVTETVARLSLKAREKNISLKLDFEPELLSDETILMVTGERQLLTCLFENIIENAIKYSAPDTQVRVHLTRENGRPCFEVTDQGPGISEDLRDRLKYSERFFRGQHTDTVSGTGIGLYLVSKIADYHGAQLSMENLTPPPGARFRVVFLKA